MRRALLAGFILLAVPSFAFAWNQATLVNIYPTSVQVGVVAKYAACPQAPVRMDLWLMNQPPQRYGGTNIFQDDCRLASPMPDGSVQGQCFWKLPVPAGTPANNVLVRLWSIASDCKTY